MIRKATPQDLPALRRIYDAAKAYMDANGNPTQWTEGYPTNDLLRADIAQGTLHAIERDGVLCGAFVLVGGEEPFYAQIDGAWRDESPYATLHRVASAGGCRGVFREAVNFARARFDHLRVDTHADNRPMQRAIADCGFAHCGVVDYGPAGLRVAYEWNRSGAGMPRVSVVTGGANGIGRCIAEQFAARGDIICVIDRDAEALERLRARLDCFTFAGDIGEKAVLDAFADAVIERCGRVDALVNNACFSNGGLENCSWEDFNAVLRVGVSAPFYLTKRFLPVFGTQAAIVNIASTRAFMSQANTESYTAAKGGIAALTHGMSVTLAGRARVNSIAPGWIEVGGWHGEADFVPAYSLGDTAQHPVGRVGKPEDIAAVALFLTSSESGFITGENITVDGGMTRLMIYHDDCGWSYVPEKKAEK